MHSQERMETAIDEVILEGLTEEASFWLSPEG